MTSRLPVDRVAAPLRSRAPGVLGFSLLLGLLLWPLLAAPAAGQSLRGSHRSIERQSAEARRHGFPYLRTSSEVRRSVEAGRLVPIRDSADFLLKEVSFPYARPEVALFIRRLAREYRESCGDRLVVTSLTRPRSRQPANASPRSVHPTGMALDLRRPWSASCRRWLESTLLYLEHKGVLEASLERRPPHYHVALFPLRYASFLEQADSGLGLREHMVVRGDTLFRIARRYSTTVDLVKQTNGLRSSRIYPGQLLRLPGSR